MSFPSFASGEVLTAADMNAVGLWLVKSQAVGTGVSSVTVTGAFSADYDNYKVIYADGAGSTIAVINMRLGSTAAGYFNAGMIVPYTGATSASQNNNAAQWSPVGVFASDYANLNFEILSPFLSKKTFIAWDYLYATGEYIRAGGYLNDTSSYTSFTIITGGGTLTGGTIRVYGYRK
jgi:hypothetical protein